MIHDAVDLALYYAEMLGILGMASHVDDAEFWLPLMEAAPPVTRTVQRIFTRRTMESIYEVGDLIASFGKAKTSL